MSASIGAQNNIYPPPQFHGGHVRPGRIEDQIFESAGQISKRRMAQGVAVAAAAYAGANLVGLSLGLKNSTALARQAGFAHALTTQSAQNQQNIALYQNQVSNAQTQSDRSGAAVGNFLADFTVIVANTPVLLTVPANNTASRANASSAKNAGSDDPGTSPSVLAAKWATTTVNSTLQAELGTQFVYEFVKVPLESMASNFVAKSFESVTDLQTNLTQGWSGIVTDLCVNSANFAEDGPFLPNGRPIYGDEPIGKQIKQRSNEGGMIPTTNSNSPAGTGTESAEPTLGGGANPLYSNCINGLEAAFLDTTQTQFGALILQQKLDRSQIGMAQGQVDNAIQTSGLLQDTLQKLPSAGAKTISIPVNSSQAFATSKDGSPEPGQAISGSATAGTSASGPFSPNQGPSLAGAAVQNLISSAQFVAGTTVAVAAGYFAAKAPR